MLSGTRPDAPGKLCPVSTCYQQVFRQFQCVRVCTFASTASARISSEVRGWSRSEVSRAVIGVWVGGANRQEELRWDASSTPSFHVPTEILPMFQRASGLRKQEQLSAPSDELSAKTKFASFQQRCAFPPPRLYLSHFIVKRPLRGIYTWRGGPLKTRTHTHLGGLAGILGEVQLSS